MVNWPTKKLGEILDKFRKERGSDIFCAICNIVKENDRFCEKCGKETNTVFKKQLTEISKIRTSLSIKQKRPNFGLVKELFQGYKPSGDPKFSEGVDIQMVVDRENNEYRHVVKDNKTNKIIHGEHELLTEHHSKDAK